MEAPTVTLSDVPATVDSTDPFDITVDFSVNVNFFRDLTTDVIVGNGSATSITENTESNYTVEITPDGTGDVTIMVPAEVAAGTDSNSNFNRESSTSTVTYDFSPTVTLSSVPSGVNSTNPFDVTVTFSEDVTGFSDTATDLSITNGSVTSITGGPSVYTVEITPDGTGDVTFNVVAGAAQNGASDNNRASATSTVTYDTVAPTVSLSSVPATVNSTAPFDVTVTFSEDVTDFDDLATDLSVTNGSITGIADGPAVYTVEITPDGNGDIGITVAAAAAQDVGGNDNTASTTSTVTFDNVAPTVSLSGVPTIVNSTDPFTVTATFSEAVTGFNSTANDLTITNGSTTGITAVSTTEYTVEITPDGNGNIGITVAAAAAQDDAGNDNTASTTSTVTFDNVAPTATLSDVPAAVNSTNTIDVTVTFSEDVTDFDDLATDVTVTNASVAAISPFDAESYNINITPDGNGDIDITVAAGAAQDAAGNDNTVSTTSTVIFDNVAPTVALSSVPATVNSTAPFDVTVTFSEDVTGFDDLATDLSVTNGSITGIADGPAVYTVEITPDGNGDVSVSVAAAAAQDVGGNDNTVSTTSTVTFDNVAPTVSLSGVPAAVNSTAPFDVTVTFSEAVTGFNSTANDLTITNGSTTGITAVSTTEYTVEITPDGNGNIGITVAAGAAQDDAGNNNTASTTSTVTFDNVAPTATLSDVPAAVNSTNTIDVTVTFSEDVTDFDDLATDVTVTNASVVAISPFDAESYNINITPDGNGDIDITVAAGAAQDAAGNGNTVSTTSTVIFDNVAPTVALSSVPATVNSTAPFDVTVTFSEDVTDFDDLATDLSVTNGSITGIADGPAVYTVEITPDGNGNIGITVAAAAAQDVGGNDNTASTTSTVTFDNVAPTVSLSGVPAAVNSTDPFTVTATFSEAVTGFNSTANDLTITNGSTTGITAVSTTQYTVEITPDGNGNIGITVAAAAAQDDAGNDNTASTTSTVTFDNVAPTVSLSGVPATVNSTNTIDVTVTFSEDVTDFDDLATDVTVTNASVIAISPFDAASYNINITPDGNGDIDITVAAGAAQDAAGNDNTVSTTSTVIFDNVAPTVALSSVPATVNSTAPFDVTVTFSEDVTDFDDLATDLSVTNGSITGIADGPAVYTVEITPDGNGNIGITVAAAAAQDVGGNDNTASTTSTVTFDNVAPTVSLSGVPAAVNSTDPFTVTATFSEAVTGFNSTANDLTITNGSTTGITAVSTTEYTVEITPDGNGNIGITVAAAAAQDDAGNDNTASTTSTVTFDNVAPTATLSDVPAAVNSTNTIDVTVTFSEDVTDFDDLATDVTVTNASVVAISPFDAESYNINITPDGNGDIDITVAAGAAQDAAGNGNTVSTTSTVIFDNVAPTVTLSNVPATVNSTAPFDVTVTFSEDVTDFDDLATDLSVTNGSITGIADGPAVYTVEITPDGNGDVSVSVAAAAAQDVAGNDNTASTTSTVTFDNVAPTVSLSGVPTIVNSTDPFTVTATFSEAVTGFNSTANDLTITNGSTTGITAVSTTQYTVEITPDGNGNIGITVAAAAAQDDAGNDNTASTTSTVTFDNVAPTVSLSGVPAAVNSTDPFTVTATFSEAVTGFDDLASDLVVVRATVTGITAVSATEYTVEITPDGNGDVSITVAAGAAQDVAGNDNPASTTSTVTFDSDAPTVTLSSVPTFVNSMGAFDITVTFSEDVSGFTGASDLTLVNASFVSMTGGNTTFTVTVSPDGGGDISITVPANVAQDGSGNDNSASLTSTVVFDNVRPSATVSNVPTFVNSTDPFNVTVTFSEDVTGFDDLTNDLIISNGTATGITGGPSVYDLEVTPNGNGDVFITVDGNAAQDEADNGNTSSVIVAVTFDNVAPTVTLSNVPATVNSTAPFNVTATFSEDVTGFDDLATDLVVVRATVTGITAVSASEYTVEITPDGTGDVSITAVAAAAQDAAGNDNTASTTSTVTFDNVAPTVTLSNVPATVNSTAPFNVTATFSEDVTDFDDLATDLSVTNGSITGIADGPAVYTVEITPDGNGDVSITVAAGAAQDGSGNDNTASATSTVTFDNVAPTVTLSNVPATVNSTDPFDVTVTFSEDVSGFDDLASDLSITNGSATGITAVSATEYTVEITPDGAGDIGITVAAGAAQDGSGNDNTASATSTVTFDTVAPTVTLSNVPATVNSTDPFDVTVTFSEDVSGFDDLASDLVVVRGTVTGITAVSASEYTVEVTPDGTGDVSITVA
ncbi:Ig-like domain-containing protein, partial [Pseudovibrio ascidiaceicola]|uniref:Ig-like domain-containing protein n=1 Tax=Pseudovibrio ascidiaceicola TaxID=285279 RepID=UPI003D36A7C8